MLIARVPDGRHERRASLGPFRRNIRLQPSELAKPVIIVLSGMVSANAHPPDRQHERDDYPCCAAAAGLHRLLILKEPDLGTAMVCAAVLMMMLYLAGHADEVDRAWPYLRLPPVMYYMLFHVAFRAARMKAFLHPEADPKGAGFHIMQSLIAVGTGGIQGRGLMEGVQKLFFLPEPHTDFIFANICEELGLIGALCVLAAFFILGYRGLRTAFLSTDPFARFLAFGLTTAILVQAFFNMSVVLALLPTKGIPLPFISSGGTSVFVTLACMGVLLNVTREID